MGYYFGKFVSGLTSQYFSDKDTYYDKYGDGRGNLPLAILRYISLKYKDVPGSNLSLAIQSDLNIEFIDKFDYKGDGFVFISYAPWSEVTERANISSHYKKEDGWLSFNGDDEENPCLITNYIQGAVRNAQCAVRIYVNKEAHKVVVFSNITTTTMINAFTSILPKVLTWIYPNDLTALDEEEKTLFSSIAKDDIDATRVILDAFVDKTSIRDDLIKTKLTGWNVKGIDDLIESKKYSITQNYSQIETWEKKVKEYYKVIETLNAELSGLIATKQSPTNEVADFFATHKQIEIYNIGEHNIDFYICDTLEWYDHDDIEAMFKNPSTYIHDYSKKKRALLYALFVQNKAKLRVRSSFTMQNTSCLYPTSRNNFGTLSAMSDAIPHPHLGHHNCLGGNSNYIDKALSEGNWDLAIEQAISATKNINFGDITVIGEFVGDLIKFENTKCVIEDDENEITIKQFFNKYCKELNV